MTFDVNSGPKFTSSICKILKVKTIGFLTSSDLKRPWLTLNDLLLEYTFLMLYFKHHIDYVCSKISHACF